MVGQNMAKITTLTHGALCKNVPNQFKTEVRQQIFDRRISVSVPSSLIKSVIKLNKVKKDNN